MQDIVELKTEETKAVVGGKGAAPAPVRRRIEVVHDEPPKHFMPY
jgi:hypothetical protein